MRVAILDAGYACYAEETAVFAEAGIEIVQDPSVADGLMLRYKQVDDTFLDALPQLRAIVRYGVGYDNIDVDACSRHKVRVANVQGYANHSVSDHALGLILACSRNLREGMRLLRETYCSPPRPETMELQHQTLGIIGLGNIGRELARKARPLFARVMACDPHVNSTRFTDCAERVALSTLLRESDVISLHCDLNDSSRGLIDEATFAAMVRRPILINTSRGEVIVPDALFAALDRGQLHSVGIDVFPVEPPGADWDAFLAHPHVIATGHYAWHSATATRKLQQRAATNMVAMLRGESPSDCLNL
jgi:D-3-phosphoglycerate dehydrogenase / 2-oxoglutarate reductase